MIRSIVETNRSHLLIFAGSVGFPSCRRLKESAYVLGVLTWERTERSLSTSDFVFSL